MMTKDAYFKLVKEVGANVRANCKNKFGQSPYCRIFSEPRANRSYRTKFWYTASMTNKLAEYISKEYGHYFEVESQKMKKTFHGWHPGSVVLRPKFEVTDDYNEYREMAQADGYASAANEYVAMYGDITDEECAKIFQLTLVQAKAVNERIAVDY